MFPAFPPLFPALVAALPAGSGTEAPAAVAYLWKQRPLAVRVYPS